MSNEIIDDDDDAWSYSFPPSVESLPLPVNKVEGTKPEKPTNNYNSIDRSSKRVDDTVKDIVGSDSKESNNNLNKRDKTEDIVSSQSSSASSAIGAVNIGASRKDHLQVFTSTSHTSSRSSLSLQSPFLVKSTPADPHTTKEDANSIISKEALGNGLEESLSQNNATPLNSPGRSGFLSNVKNTIKYQSQQSEATINEDDDVPQTPSNDSTYRNTQLNITTPSPKIITYRKSKRSISEGNFQIDSAITTPKEKYDTKLYADEMYKDTSYRYATMKRNTDFHQLFRSLDLTDRLLDDFSCALSREILLQGRIYISEHYICFNSNLLGWVTSLIIPLEDIIRLEKKSTAGLFPNGILIETKNAKHNFASFLSRDATFEFMKTVWQEATGRKMEVCEENQSARYAVDENKIVSNDQSNYSQNSPQFESYILSIDGDGEGEGDEDNYSSGFSDIDGSVKNIDDSSIKKSNLQTVNTKILKFKDDSKYRNMGPELHSPTDIGKDFSKDENEIELCDEIIEAPMGIVFDILFGSSNISFHRKFLENQNASEISEYDNFHPMEEDPTKLERTYNYRRALGYSIGPKSTKCEVSEIIEHLNFADYVVVLTSTATPDVPSGNSFSVKTRYCFTWGTNNTTNLRISYFIKWTGRSWIRSVIEKQSLAGQTTTTKDLLESLREEIEATTYYAEGPSIVKTPISIEEPPLSRSSESLVAISKKAEVSKEKTIPPFSANEFVRNNIVSVCYFILSFLILLLILQLKIFRIIKETNDLARSQLLVNSHLVYTVQSLANHKNVDKLEYEEKMKSIEQENNKLWEWVNDRFGKELNSLEKVEYLTYQLNALYQKERQSNNYIEGQGDDDKFSAISQSVKDFKYQDLLNIESIKNILGELI